MLAIAALVVLQVLAPGGLPGTLSYFGADAVATLCAWRGARRWQAGARWVPHLVAAGVTLTAAGDAVYQLLVWWHGVEPSSPSMADPLWLAQYVPIAVALFGSFGPRRRFDVDGLIDLAVVVVVTGLVEWVLVVTPAMGNAGGALAPSVEGLYPVLDVVLLALVLRATVTSSCSPTGRWVAVGAACWMATDLVWVLSTSSALDRWTNAGWLVGAAALAFSTWHPRAELPQAEPDDLPPIGVARLAIALVPVAVPAVLHLVGDLRGEPSDPYLLVGATSALILLAFWRAGRLARAERLTRARLLARERHARALASTSSDALVVADPDGRLSGDLGPLSDFLGWPVDVGEGLSTALRVSPLDRDALRAAWARCARTARTQVEIRSGDGPSTRWLAVRLAHHVDDPDVGGVVLHVQDVTARKEAEERLLHQALHDEVTGLANRALLCDRTELALRRRTRATPEPAIARFQVDGLKALTDSLGQDVGDRFLVVLARRLEATFRIGDVVARLGDASFAVLFDEGWAEGGDLLAALEAAMPALAAPVALDGRAVQPALCGGLAVARPDTDGAAALLRDADLAVHHARLAGPSRCVAYAASMGAAAEDELALGSDLDGALARGELVLRFQPVVRLDDAEVVGVEALLRWDHPTRGLLTPDRFVPLAEASDAIVDIGRWVLATACRTAASWHAAHPTRPMSLAVNVSGRQLVGDHLVEDVRRALATSGLDPRALVLELTETAVVEDPAHTAAQLGELRALGVRVAVDDFGTGWSTLAYLRQLPVDVVKVDRTFTSTIVGPDLPPIVQGMLDLARTLGLEVVAEGIEDDRQHAALRAAGCELGQGYLFARPMEPADVVALLARQPAPRT